MAAIFGVVTTAPSGAPSVFIEHVLSFALDDHQRSLVVEERPWIQKLATQVQHLFRR